MIIRLVIYVINTIIRILCAWGLFSAFAAGYYFLAGLCLVGTLRRYWLVYNGNKVYINVDGFPLK